MPVFLSLFYMLRKDLKEDICGPALRAYLREHTHATITGTGCDTVAHGSAKFLFIPDLTTAATGGVLITLIVLYVVSQLGSSLLMSTTVDKNQRFIMLALPFVFVLFIRTFPAGLIVYWITTNFWTVGQQYLVRRRVGPMPPAPTALGGGKKAPTATPAPAATGRKAPSLRRGGGNGASAAPAPATPSGPPPPPPRKKKKRSGRRR
jgi:YidC/Oxa1 family membrane protein insertase